MAADVEIVCEDGGGGISLLNGDSGGSFGGSGGGGGVPAFSLLDELDGECIPIIYPSEFTLILILRPLLTVYDDEDDDVKSAMIFLMFFLHCYFCCDFYFSI